ncbi:alpha/beta fold hydrolase [Mesonia mobilis]|uniref:Alpha/beta hydrolase n=1 Tax=Mesonia mobilis TaxID=369791 RepID=A0ABQ3BKV3_9FLAO|nr:alpha/beta hydrolase [Mesonia mobilis]MBQ0737671.1 alpha/beta hydrolase [Aquimarina celericrescens]GGZ44488.1 alpha/beta hydrolase [Mesonia mobilis]
MQEYISYKNIQIAFTVEGKGKTIVLLHGFLESSTILKNVVSAFKETHQLVTIDLLGHGKTEKLGYIHSMETMAETVHAVLAELKIEKASIIGHSMGGYVALAFAEKFPQQLEKLILLNSSTVADSEERKENRDRAKRLVKQNKQAFISMAIKNLFTYENRNALRTEIDALVEEAVQLPEENIIASVEGLKNRKDRTEILQQYSGEKIIIAGKNDPVVPFKEIEAIAEKTNSTFISFEDGHMSYLENKVELLKVLNELF